MSTLTYNGVTLTHLLTRQIVFEPVKSDDSVDTLYTHVSFDVSGLISAPLSPAALGENATQTLARVQHVLEQPRAAFQYAVDGQALVTWLGGPDARNGPFPRGVQVQRVDGSELYHITFGIDLYLNTCPADPRFPYVSHRWTEEVTIDDAARTTKTRRGKIITRGDVFTNPDALRGLVMPPIDRGFLREESKYVLQSDGLALEYAYQDREQFIMPPPPAWKAEGTYTESTANGAKRHGEVRLHLRGSKGTNKGELLKTAILVAVAKMDAAGVQRGRDRAYIAVGGVQENLYEPEVSITVKAILQAYPGRVAGLPINLRRFTDFPAGSQPGQNQFAPPDPGTRGTAGLRLVAAALNDPCLSQTVLRAGGAEPSGPSILQGQGAPELAQVYMTPVLPNDAMAVLKTGLGEPGIWSHYRVRIRTVHDRHMISMPVGKEGEDPVIIQTGAPSQNRVVRWYAEKIGDAPELPDPDIGPNFILAKATIDTEAVEPHGDGLSLKYVVAGKYVYHVKTFSQAVLYAGRPPWLSDAALPDVLKAVTKFAKGIIDLGLMGYGAVFNAAGGVSMKVTNLP